MVKNFKKYIIVVQSLFFSSLIIISLLMVFPGPLSEDTKIVIPSGTSAHGVINILKKEDVIYSKSSLLILMKLLRLDKKFIPGEFLVKKNISPLSLLLYIMNDKNIIYYKITLVEGLTVKQILQNIADNPHLQGEITLKPKEGTLMPDTYFFRSMATRDSIIKTMQDSMTGYLDNLWMNRNLSLPYKTKEEALIFASLVEKEASYADERGLIAGVFLNRLRLGMRLQTDPTVAYGLGKENADKLTRADLKADHPYNTYIIYGLPPTPIANPSRKSLIAVFDPTPTKFLYFVANGNGGHIFSKNLIEHNRHVANWRVIEQGIRAREAKAQKNK